MSKHMDDILKNVSFALFEPGSHVCKATLLAAALSVLA